MGGPLPIDDCPYVDEGERLWLQAARAAGYPLNDDFNGASQEGVGLFQLTARGGERFGTAKAYLAPASGRSNLTVKTGVLTTRILIEKGRAVGVEYLDQGRRGVSFAASDGILAAPSPSPPPPPLPSLLPA